MRGAAFVFAVGLVACGSDPDRPPAASSGGSSASSGGGSSSGGTSSGGDGGGSSSGDDGGSSSGTDGGSSSGTTIPTGLRASIDNAAREFTEARKALRQSGGTALDVSGRDSAGNELRLVLTNTTGNVAPGSYDCNGNTGTTYGVIAYVVTGGVATWNASAAGECTISVLSIDNQVGGMAVATFSGTAKRAASTDYLITKGQFRLTLE